MFPAPTSTLPAPRAPAETAPSHRVRAGAVLPYALSSGISALLGVVNLVVLTRLLPPAGYGAYAVVVTAVTLGQTAFFHWLSNGVLRFHPGAEGPAGVAQLGRAARAGFLLSSGAAVLSWAAAALVVPPPDFRAAAAGLAMVIARGWMSVVLSWNRSAGRHWRYVATEAGCGVGTLALAVAGLRLRPGDPAVPLLAATVAGLLAAALSREPDAARGAGHGHGGPPLRALVREMWGFGAPLTLVALASVVLAASDRLLIGAVLGPADAGAYSVAASIADRAVSLVLLSITLATKPLVFAEYERRGEASTRALLARVAGWVMTAGFPAATVLVFAPGPVAALLVGGGMAPAAAAMLPWLAAGALLSGFMALHFGLAFQITRRTTGLLAAVVPAAALNVAANLVLLPRYGVMAAAWTTLGSYAVATALVIALGRRHFAVPFPAGAAARTAAACVPLALFVRLQPFSTPGAAVLVLTAAAAVYAVSAFALDVAGVRTGVAPRSGRGLRPPGASVAGGQRQS